MPLIYDRTRTGTLACAKELGNVAIAAIPKRASRSQGEYDAEMNEFLVSIKASSRPRSRLALHCAVGILNATAVLQILDSQATLTFGYHSVLPTRQQTQGSTGSLRNFDTLRSGNVRQRFHGTVNAASSSRELFPSVTDRELWTHPLQCVQGWLGRDSRLFFLRQSGHSISCLLGYRKRRKGGSILVLGALLVPYMTLRYNLLHQGANTLVTLNSIHQLRKSERLKNLMPLVVEMVTCGRIKVKQRCGLWTLWGVQASSHPFYGGLAPWRIQVLTSTG